MAKRTKAQAEAAFWARITTLGARRAPGARYVNTTTAVPLICAAGHECAPRPADVGQGGGICRRCSKRDLRAEEQFWTRVAELGGRPQPGAVYVNGKKPVPLWCSANHECRPKPTSLQMGQGICRKCTDPRMRRARENFWARVEELGAQAAEGAVYRDRLTPVALTCRAGHDCTPTPDDVIRRSLVCGECGVDRAAAEAGFLLAVAAVGAHLAPGSRYSAPTGRVAMVCANGHPCRPAAADVRPGRAFCPTCLAAERAAVEAQFWQRVADLGGRPAEGAHFYTKSKPVHLLCAEGHPCAPAPMNVLRGVGICQVCASNSPAEAAKAFWARVAELGATPMPGAKYAGKDTPVPLTCQAGHACSPTPANLRRGQGPCLPCFSAEAAAEAEAEFWDLVELQGAAPRPGARYVNGHTPVSLTCPDGHEIACRPGYLRSGGGLCPSCSISHDRVYLLEHPAAGAIKVGIASGTRRVALHQGRGYRLVAQWTGLDHVVATSTERTVLRNWRDAGLAPVTGVPIDGRTETAPAAELTNALACLERLLGPADQQNEQPEPATAALAA